MRRQLLGFGVMCIGMAGLGSNVGAVPISVFLDPSYVDTSEEGANLVGDVLTLGNTTSTFTGITSADFTTGVGTNQILLFPEMEVDNLASDLTGAAAITLTNLVTGGGHMIQANAFPSNASLPNLLFGLGLANGGSIGATNLNVANAAGTAFAGGPASLPLASAVEGLLGVPGAMRIYDNGTATSVFTMTYGAGRYTYLGFDWFQQPTPAEWLSVLDRAIATQSIPEPTSLSLLGVGLVAFGLMRRRRRVA